MKISLSLLAALLLFTLIASGCGATAPPTAAPEAQLPEETEAVEEMVPDETEEDTPAVLPTPTEAPPAETPEPVEEPAVPMAVSSPAFIDGETIPDVHSCFGENTSPALAWDGIPEDAQSLALIVDDPDSAPPGFIHWVIYNIPPEGAGLPGAVPGDAELADGSRQAQNDFAPYGAGAFPGGAEIKLVGYDGMCPGGEHRYVFTLYALDTLLDIPAGSLPADVKAALAGHILDQAQLIGRFAPPQ